jgi:hypothetical protein
MCTRTLFELYMQNRDKWGSRDLDSYITLLNTNCVILSKNEIELPHLRFEPTTAIVIILNDTTWPATLYEKLISVISFNTEHFRGQLN